MELLNKLRQMIQDNEKLPKSIKDEFLDQLDNMEIVLLAWSE